MSQDYPRNVIYPDLDIKRELNISRYSKIVIIIDGSILSTQHLRTFPMEKKLCCTFIDVHCRYPALLVHMYVCTLKRFIALQLLEFKAATCSIYAFANLTEIVVC